MVCTISTVLLFSSVTSALSFSNYLERRHYLYIALIAVTASIFGTLTIIVLDDDFPNYPAIGIFWGSFIVAAGWITTNEMSILNSRKQHTVNLITAYFTNAQLIKDRKTIQKSFPSYKDKVTDKFNFHARNEVTRAIVRELNYYEFLAAALYRRDLNETLLNDCLGQIIINVYEQMEEYIVYWRQENSDWWRYLAQLHLHWTTSGGAVSIFRPFSSSAPAPLQRPPHSTTAPAR